VVARIVGVVTMMVVMMMVAVVAVAVAEAMRCIAVTGIHRGGWCLGRYDTC
jgi:uncharacterized membrane protein